ncbi:hypothetical protein LJC25_04325 [Bacteroidales bacterium OttesenSCG-928-K03]|nr:hypothetical protein [Odoribacter sp. OttesenSCG-928-L07]MDL2239706.1 uridine kinase [Bacteroidales bacterium OttesenSCG-928-L14]MDL2242936.1 hypothetical protein [Bacteroidales bacterium OttesenSCG-928-K03]
MLGDILYINEKHKKTAAELYQVIENKRSGKIVIAISGESGSGKSVLSHCLATEYKKAGIRAKILHTDNYYKILPELRNKWRQDNGMESVGYSEYDWNTLNSNILSFKNGSIADTPCVDLLTDQVDRLITDFSTVEILILDGLYAIKSEEVDLKIFIDITYHDTKLAQISRGKEAQTPLRKMILQKEHEMVSALKPLANIIIDFRFQISDSK